MLGVSSTGVGLYGQSVSNKGVQGESTYGYGLYGHSGTSIGVYGESTNYTAVYGGSVNSVGIQGYSANSYGVFGQSDHNYAGFFSGDVYATGSYQSPSDERFKTHIATLPNALETILALCRVTFDWKREEFPNRNFPKRTQIGFIAQEMEKVLPELVHTDKEGYKSVAYTNLVPLLVESIKALKKENESLKETLAGIMKRLEAVEYIQK